jgi:DNA-binding transcriptional regulator/RsmH inhibitor MraZ
MSSHTKELESHFDYKMDPKFRVSVPVEWRPESDETVIRLQLSNEHEIPVIKVYDQEKFDEKFDKVAKSDLTEARKQHIVGHLRMMSKKTFVSSQGKLTLPKDWCEKVGCQANGSVVLAGRGSFYMICNPQAFDRIIEIELKMSDGGTGVL